MLILFKEASLQQVNETSHYTALERSRKLFLFEEVTHLLRFEGLNFSLIFSTFNTCLMMVLTDLICLNIKHKNAITLLDVSHN